MPGILWVRRNQEHNLIGTTTTQIHDKNIYEFLNNKESKKSEIGIGIQNIRISKQGDKHYRPECQCNHKPKVIQKKAVIKYLQNVKSFTNDCFTGKGHWSCQSARPSTTTRE